MARVTWLEAQSRKLGQAVFSKESTRREAAHLQRRLAVVEEADLAKIRALGLPDSPMLKTALREAETTFHARHDTARALERHDEAKFLRIAERGAAAGVKYHRLARQLGFKVCESLD